MATDRTKYPSMKLFEVMNTPNAGTDGLEAGFLRLPPLLQQHILKHYRLSNISQANTLSPDRLGDIVHDVQYFQAHPDAAERVYNNTPLEDVGEPPEPKPQKPVSVPPTDFKAKQAGYNVGDNFRYGQVGGPSIRRKQTS